MNAVRFVGATCVALCLGTTAWGQVPLEELPLDLDVSDMPVARVLDIVGRQTAQVFDVDAEVDERVTLRLRSVSWRHALNEIAKAARCEIEQRNGWVRLYQVPRVTYRCKDTDVRTVLLELARRTKQSVVVAPDVRVAVNLDLVDTPCAEAFALTARAAGLQLVQIGECSVVSRAKLQAAAPVGPRRVQANLADCAALQGKLDVELRDEPLRSCLDALGKRLGVNLVVSQGFDARNSAWFQGPLPAHALLEVLARRNRCDVEALGPELFYFSQPVRVSLTRTHAPLSGALLEFAAYGGKPVLLRPELQAAEPVSFSFHEVRYETALRALATAMSLSVHRASTGEITLARSAISANDPRPLPADSAERMDVEAKRLPLPQLLAQLGEHAGGELRVDPATQLKLSLSLRGVTWQEALRVVAREVDGVLQTEAGDSIRLTLCGRPWVSAYAAPLAELLRLVGEQAGSPVRVDPAVKGYVSAEIGIHHGTLEVLARTYGLSLEVSEGEARLGWTAEAAALFAGRLGVQAPVRARSIHSRSRDYTPAPGDVFLEVERTFASLESLSRRQAQAWAGGEAGRVATLKAINAERTQVHERVLRRYLDGDRGAVAFPAGVAAFTRPHTRARGPFDHLVHLDREVVLGTLTVGEANRLHRNGEQQEALELLERAEAVYTSLRRTGERDFLRVAEVLYLRSRQLTELVQESLEVEQFPLRVSATCYTGEASTSVALLNGQPVREGDRLELEGVEEPLYVREIYTGSVNLRYKQTRFTRQP